MKNSFRNFIRSILVALFLIFGSFFSFFGNIYAQEGEHWVHVEDRETYITAPVSISAEICQTLTNTCAAASNCTLVISCQSYPTLEEAQAASDQFKSEISPGETPPEGSSPSAPQTPGGGTESGFQLLAPIPGRDGFEGSPDLATYLSGAYSLTVGLAGVLAVLMIVIGGIEYIFSAVPSAKEDAKRRIRGAVFGLILALTSYILLQTLNPQLLEVGFTLPLQQGVTVVGEDTGPPEYATWSYTSQLNDQPAETHYIRDQGPDSKTTCDANLKACANAPGCRVIGDQNECQHVAGQGDGQDNPPGAPSEPRNWSYSAEDGGTGVTIRNLTNAGCIANANTCTESETCEVTRACHQVDPPDTGNDGSSAP